MVEQQGNYSPTVWIKFWVLFLALSGLLLFLHTQFVPFDISENKLEFLYELVWLVIISSWLSFGGRLKDQVKQMFIWLCIFMVLITAYSYRFELESVKDRVVATLVPGYGMDSGFDSMSYSLARDGHFYIRSIVNGVPVRFLVDTGASHIVIAPSVAEKLGYSIADLEFNRLYKTANGTVRGSSIRLSKFSIGKFQFQDIAASVNEAPMDVSLLGMSFFSLLSGYEVSEQQLTLKWDSRLSK